MTDAGSGDFRLVFGINAKLEVSTQDYPLLLQLAYGNGPAVVTIGPGEVDCPDDPTKKCPPAPLSLGAMLGQLAQLLKIGDIAGIGALAASPPWDQVFQVEIAPQLTVQLSSQPSVQLVLELWYRGTPGVHLPGTWMPAWLKIEPNFTVHSLIVGYDAKAGGLDLRALVTFDEQPTALAARGGSAADEPGKTELVSFPFPSPPPASPNLQIKYLGLGQHFGPIVDLQAPDPLAQMFTALESTFTTNNPATLLSELAGYYDAQRDWFVGAHVLLRGWEIRAVFNDPVLYGLEITCTVGAFEGLLLEILYQKLGDGLGVYYGAFTLPARYRTIQLGVVSLTLPSFKIWIYTNGDFKVSVGWPLGPNSIGIQVYVFTGGGGFYFAKLRSGDNPSSGQKALVAARSDIADDVESYNPILEFGLGAWFGLGRSISSGPFSASLSLTLQGTFQGLLAWQAPPPPGPGLPPPTASVSRPPDYYWFAATVSLIGQLQGAVDLKVIKLSVFVRLSVTAGVALETGYASQVLVSASVDVEASLKIFFVRISVSFHTTITETFEISGGAQPPASLNGPNNPAFAGMNDWTARGLSVLEDTLRQRLTDHAPALRIAQPLPPAPAGHQTIELDFLLQPSAVYVGTTGAASAVATLTIGCPAPGPTSADSQTPLELLLIALGSWLLRTYASDGHWDSVVSALGEGSAAPPAGWGDALAEFLQNEICFVLNPVDLNPVDLNLDIDPKYVAFFPMLSSLALTYEGQTTEFGEMALTTADYEQAVTDYFAALSLNDGGRLLSEAQQATTPAGPPLADVILDDYLLTVARQLARENAATDPTPGSAVAANIGGLSSRYLLSGLRLPDPATVPESGPIDPTILTIDCGYALTGQQFPVNSTEATASATLQLGSGPSTLAVNIAFAGGASSVTSTMPVSDLPPAPAPIWSGPGDVPNAAATVTIDAIPAALTRDRTVAVRSRLPWVGPAPEQFVVPLPPAVLSEMREQPLQLTVSDGAPQPRVYPTTPMLLIPVTLHLVNRARDADLAGSVTNSPYAPFVYRVDGTDDETRNRIEAALAAQAVGSARISVLYDGPHSGYESDPVGSYSQLLVKTNLSTTSQPDGVGTSLRLRAEPDNLGPTTAAISDPTDFLRLLWEVSVVRSGGLYLHYQNAAGQGLPGEIFCPPGQTPVGGVPTGDSATVTIAIVFAGETTYRSWHNAFAVELPMDYQGTLRLDLARDGMPVQDLSPSYPPGCIAFSGSWADEGLLRAESIPLYDCDWVAHLYQLLQFRVDGDRPGSTPTFGSSLWSLALTPSQDDLDPESTAQTYRQVVPVYRFLTDPALAGNPYATVGGSPVLTMRLLDVFGNTLDADTYSAAFDVRYNDPLWSPAEWPGVRIAFRFVSGIHGSTLALDLQFDPAAVIRTGGALGPMMVHGLAQDATDDDKIAQQVEVALQQYSLVVGQLGDPHTTATVRSSVLPSLEYSTGVVTTLYSFATDIVAELGKVLSGRLGTPEKLSTSIDVLIDPADLATATADVLELVVTLELSRPEVLVFTDATGHMVPRSASNLAVVAPNFDPPDSGTPRALARAQADGAQAPVDVALTRFAQDFEQVFTGFDHATGKARLAVRSDSADLSSPDTTFLWVIRWSRPAGVRVDVGAGQAAYFSLAPLSLRLEGGAAQVPTYGPDPATTTYTERTFSGIDLDAWAESFLLAFDGVLAPELATTIAAIDPDSYNQLMSAKNVLAQCLAATVVPVYAPGATSTVPGDPAGAREQLEQAARGSLSAAYGTASIVQVPVTVSTAGDDGPPELASRLFGGLQAQPLSSHLTLGVAPEISVSSAKLPLVAGPSYLTFSVAVADAAVAANVAADFHWRVRFTEHLTTKVAEYDYQPSEWLRVVLAEPDDPLDFDLGTLSIPIPERRFPTTPVLGAQSAVQAPPSEAGDDPLAAYLRWNYGADLTLPQLAAQDALWLEVTYNLPITQITTQLTDAELTLFQALASFTSAWPQLSAWLAGVIDGQTAPEPVKVIEAYLTQVKLVARAWARFSDVPDPWAVEPLTVSVAPGSPAVSPLTDSYQISFQDALTKQQLVVYARSQLGAGGDCDVASLHWPTINGKVPLADSTRAACTPPTAGCAGAPTSDPCWYRATYDFDPPDPGEACRLELAWPELDVLARQTAKVDCWMTRNSRLSGNQVDIPTNPSFVYQTPVVSFASPVVPTISVPAIGPLPGESTLAATLELALAAIARAGAAATGDRFVKVALDYSFELSGSAGMRATDSILLADQIALQPEGTSGAGVTLDQLCAELATNTDLWFGYYRPSTDQAVVSIYLVLFAEVAGSQLPILVVQQLQLSVPPGWWPMT